MKQPIQVFNYSIQNSANDSVDIYIDGDIVDASTQAMIKAFFGDDTSVSYKSFRNSLNKVEVGTYNVIINSPGGHVGDALAIHDLLTDLQNKGKTVNTIGRGIVASSATLILMAGNKPEMSANSWFMMHPVNGAVYGNVDEIENYSRTMRKFNDSIRDLYSSKSGLRKEEVTKLMDAETWLSASEAKEKGFIDAITGEVSFQNKIQPEGWDLHNTAILNKYNNSVKTEPQFEDMKKFFSDLGKEIMNAVKGVKPNEDQQAFVNSISEAISKPFETIGDSMETQVTEIVNKAVEPFEARIAGLEQAKLDLEKRNGELETEITNKLGEKTNAPRDPVVEPIGSYN